MKKLIYILLLWLLSFGVAHADEWHYGDGTERTGVTAFYVNALTMRTTNVNSGTSQIITLSNENLVYLWDAETVYLNRSDDNFRNEHHTDGNAASDNARNESGTTTGWSTFGVGLEFVVESTEVSKGNSAFKVVAYGAVSSSAHYDLSSFCSNGNSYIVSFDVRHIGSGGNFEVNLGTTVSGGQHRITGNLTSSDTTYTSYRYPFIYDATHRYLTARENSATNDGGVYIDNISITSPDLAFNRGLGSMSRSGDTSWGRDPTTGRLVHYGGNETVIEQFADVYGARISDSSGHSNYCTYSEDLSDASWTKTSSFVTNFGTAPDGTLTAYKLSANGANTVHFARVAFSEGTFAKSAIQTGSAYCQADDLNWVALVAVERDATVNSAYFNLSTGVVGTTSGISSASISEDTVNGFYRISITLMNDSEAASAVSQYRVYLSDGDGSTIFQDDAAGVTVWGIQVTEKPSAMPYLPTAGSVAVATQTGLIEHELPTSMPFDSGNSTTSLFAEDLSGELVTDGGFDTACGGGNWDCGTSWTISGSSAYSDGTSSTLSTSSNIAVVVGELYKISFEILTRSSGDVRVSRSTGSFRYTSNANFNTVDTHTVYLVATHVADFGLYSASFDGTVDNISVTHVQSAWRNKDNQLWPNRGTMIARVRFPNTKSLISQHFGLITSNSATDGLYASSSGRFSSSDSTTTAYDDNSTWPDNQWIIAVLQWGDLDSNVAKFRTGYLGANGPIWGSTVNWDGGFFTGSQLIFGHTMQGLAHFATIAIWREILSDETLKNIGY